MKRASFAVAAVLAVTAAACSDSEESTVAPLIPPTPPANPEIVSAGWTFDVLGNDGQIIVTPPTQGYDPAILGDYFGVEAGSPDLSILAGDVVEVLADGSTLAFSGVGDFIPGYRRATFEVAVRNRLAGVNLIAPTFPTPPAGTTGPILFPFETVLINVDNEGVTGGQGDGTIVIVEAPNTGQVAPSVNWDGAPFNFFNDDGCPVDANDCYRYEEFGGSILGGQTSAFQEVGFDLEATVNEFRFRGIIAADLEDATPNTPPTAAFVGEPYAGQVPNDVTVQLDGSDTDQGGGVALIEFDLDSDGVYEVSVPQAGQTASAQAAFTCSTSGSFPIVGRVIDNRGAETVANSSVDCAFPALNASVSIDAPASAQELTTQTIDVVVDNPGIGPVTGIAVEVTLDADGTLVDAGGLTAAGNVLTGTIAQLDGGTSQTYSIQVQLEAASGTPNTTTATIASGDDTDPADNSATAVIEVTPPANVFGVWTDGTAAISSASVGDVIELQICSIGDTQAFQASLSGFSGQASVGGAVDLDTPVGGVGACASAGSDVVTELTPGQLVDPFNFQSFSLSPTPGTGVQGIATISFTVTAAGELAPTLSVSTLQGFTLGALTPVVALPSIQIN